MKKKDNKYKIIGIIQARMGSKRLPNKMACYLGNYPIIDWVIQRSKKSKLLQKYVLATSTKTENDYLIERAKKYSIDSYRGSEDNVLSRFVEISLQENADIIVRICADNPFIDPIEIDRLIEFFKSNKCEYSFNHQNRLDGGYADGFGAEIFTSDLLYYINDQTLNKSHREHVTKYIWDNKTMFKIKPLKSPKKINYPLYKFDVDTIQDKFFLDNLVSSGISIDSDTKSIINLYKSLILLR